MAKKKTSAEPRFQLSYVNRPGLLKSSVTLRIDGKVLWTDNHQEQQEDDHYILYAELDKFFQFEGRLLPDYYSWFVVFSRRALPEGFDLAVRLWWKGKKLMTELQFCFPTNELVRANINPIRLSLLFEKQLKKAGFRSQYDYTDTEYCPNINVLFNFSTRGVLWQHISAELSPIMALYAKVRQQVVKELKKELQKG